MIQKIKNTLCIVSFFIITGTVYGQNRQMVDQVVAIVGDKIILQSDIENQVLQFLAQGYKPQGEVKCEILEELLAQKLLLTQAEIDSIDVGINRVEAELEDRLMYFIRQIGSEKKLEEYYNKSILEIKEDFRPLIREQLLTQMMQREIVAGISITPKEVNRFFKDIASDSIPMVNTQYEIQQIVIHPKPSEESRSAAREKLLGLRQRIQDGERFSTLAVLYSQDPGSARKGGELGFRTKEELDPEFAKAAFSLKDDGVSRIVESAFGFHLIQLVAKEGNLANVRHILIKPVIEIDVKIKAMNKLDSISTLLRLDSLKFSQAAVAFSEDEESKFNDGVMVNPSNSSMKFELDELPQEMFNVVQKLKLGELSNPFESADEKGDVVYKIIKIKRIIEPHKINVKDDYEKVEQMALSKKQQERLINWVEEHKMKTYIHIDDTFVKCEFLKKGWIK
jgi:peptidyl-prolyl cis-trans isomerase SurA